MTTHNAERQVASPRKDVKPLGTHHLSTSRVHVEPMVDACGDSRRRESQNVCCAHLCAPGAGELHRIEVHSTLPCKTRRAGHAAFTAIPQCALVHAGTWTGVAMSSTMNLDDKFQVIATKLAAPNAFSRRAAVRQLVGWASPGGVLSIAHPPTEQASRAWVALQEELGSAVVRGDTETVEALSAGPWLQSVQPAW